MICQFPLIFLVVFASYILMLIELIKVLFDYARYQNKLIFLNEKFVGFIGGLFTQHS